ncbi:MAG TPA: Xaa-Pro peptidase family protein [Fimbriimonadaceae bacterium]|nr:Xaa-Pro peptidase family protein [Fimbriimonadaceae bacterium]
MREKLEQAAELVRESGLDLWLTFDRETAEGGDPILPYLFDAGLTWHSALIVAANGERVAIVGNYDASPLEESGNWTSIVPYVQSIREPLLETLERLLGPNPRIGLNYSTSDVKCDGLSHGMYLTLCEYVKGTRFESAFESAEFILRNLRGVKTPSELLLIRDALKETDQMFDLIGRSARIGATEREIYDLVHTEARDKGLGFSWDPAGDPIVNCGPDSAVGHGLPSSTLKLAAGHILHVDLGLTKAGYSSDIQRCWYVGDSVPSEVNRAFAAVNAAITAGANALRPGVKGWEVDAAGRQSIVESGYPEYLHALGHQVGRVAHDGGTILGPRWERYGNTPDGVVRANEVYTLELGVFVDGAGYVGLEEMVLVTETGCEFISDRQTELWLLHP